MSKTSQKKKELKAEGKLPAEIKQEAKPSILNYGKCCSCKYYPKHVHGQAQPCKKLNAYVARKAEHSCWTAK